MKPLLLLLPLFLVFAWVSARAQAEETLDVYFIDVEGGHATFVRVAFGSIDARGHGLFGFRRAQVKN